MHTDASGAEPETFHAFTIGSDAFIATNGFAEVLWILARKVLPFRSVPTCRAVLTPQIGATASILLLDRFLLPLLTTNEKSINSFASNLLNCSWLRASDCVKY
jgi:hypothetical protein